MYKYDCITKVVSNKSKTCKHRDRNIEDTFIIYISVSYVWIIVYEHTFFIEIVILERGRNAFVTPL